MIIRHAKSDDFNGIYYIYEQARKFMAMCGNPTQWVGGYPDKETIKEDLELNRLYVCVGDDNVLLAVFCYYYGVEPAYNDIYNGAWLNNNSYGVIHRIAVSPDAHGRGVAAFCFNYCYNRCKNLKIDTHEDNIPMQKALAKNGFKRCGDIYIREGKRIAFQKD